MIRQDDRKSSTNQRKGRSQAAELFVRLLAVGLEAMESWLLWAAVQVTYRTRWGDSGSGGETVTRTANQERSIPHVVKPWYCIPRSVASLP